MPMSSSSSGLTFASLFFCLAAADAIPISSLSGTSERQRRSFEFSLTPSGLLRKTRSCVQCLSTQEPAAAAAATAAHSSARR